MKSGRITIGRIVNGEYILGEKPDPNEMAIIKLPEVTDSLGDFLELTEKNISNTGPFMPSEIVNKDE